MPKEKNVELNNTPKKKNSALTVVIVILVFIIVLGGVLIGILIGGRNKGKEDVSPKDLRKELKVFPLDAVTVNLADEGGKRYAKIKISFGYEENKKLEAELSASKDIAMDSVISIVRSKKSAEVDASNEKVIKENIKSKVNSILLNGQIEEVYFVDILIQ